MFDECRRHHHHTQCIPPTEKYSQGLGTDGRRQLIPIKESAAKESLDSRKNKRSFCHERDRVGLKLTLRACTLSHKPAP